ncbi:hypothetical protein B0G80_4743 [Paraburkholderia sp. BL6669N2]|nr:hypothetical protein B0G80_4743 [Paraburkholderia sp. BL6669N2]
MTSRLAQLGVDYCETHDRAREVIHRYKLDHKMHVYDLDSRHAFLEASPVRPVPDPNVKPSMPVRQRVRNWRPEQKTYSLLDLLPPRDTSKKKR